MAIRSKSKEHATLRKIFWAIVVADLLIVWSLFGHLL